MVSQRRCELTLLWTIPFVFGKHAFAQGRTEIKFAPVAKLMRRGQPLPNWIEHVKLPWTRLPKKNAMTSVVLGFDGPLDSLHGSSFTELTQDSSSQEKSDQAELWGRWRRWRQRLRRRFHRLHGAIRKFGGKYGAQLKALGNAAMTSLKACKGSLAGVVTGNPEGLASMAACVKEQALKVKADAKAILSDAKAEAVAQGKDIASASQEASSAAGVTVAHIMAFGNQLEEQAKQGNLTVVQAVRAIEAKAISETINGTVAVEKGLAQAKSATAVKKITKDLAKASSEVSAVVNGNSTVGTSNASTERSNAATSTSFK